MRKIYLLQLAAIALIGSLAGASCKKPVHSNNPTPNNSRLLSYTKITSNEAHVPLTATSDTLNENYTFGYDNMNRLVRVTFTTNDGTKQQQVTTFTYSSDTAYKTVTNILTNQVAEKDTLVFNSLGQLTTVYSPGVVTSFQYYGKLITTYTVSQRTGGVAIGQTTTYTSVNGDLLAHNYDGTLTAILPSARTPSFSTLWTPYIGTGTGVAHTNVTGYTDVLPNYNEAPIRFTSKDNLGATDTAFFAGSLWRKENYHFYTEMANRPGDWMQIQSFTNYGYNVYQNSHLVESVSSVNRHSNISYDIDAFSKITQTTVVTIDSVLNKYTSKYSFQYELF